MYQFLPFPVPSCLGMPEKLRMRKNLCTVLYFPFSHWVCCIPVLPTAASLNQAPQKAGADKVKPHAPCVCGGPASLSEFPGASAITPLRNTQRPVLGLWYLSVNASYTQSLTLRLLGSLHTSRAPSLLFSGSTRALRFPQGHARCAQSNPWCFTSGGECFIRGHPLCVPPGMLWMPWPSCLHL